MAPNEKQSCIEMSSEDLETVRGGYAEYGEYTESYAGEAISKDGIPPKTYRVCAMISNYYYWGGTYVLP